MLIIKAELTYKGEINHSNYIPYALFPLNV